MDPRAGARATSLSCCFSGTLPRRVEGSILALLEHHLAWYEEVLERVESGAVVAPGEQERLTEEASAVTHLLDLLDSSADEPAG